MGCAYNFGSKSIWDSIKRADSSLELKWNSQIDRWELYRKSGGKLHYLLKLETPDGKSCGVDIRLKQILSDCDNWKYKNVVQWARELNERDRKQKEKFRAELYDKIAWNVKDHASIIARKDLGEKNFVYMGKG